MKKELVSEVLFGADPEMFLFTLDTDKPVPVVGLVGGTKYDPLYITDKGHALQEDNVMVEYCIPPCKTAGEFVENINFVKNYINDTVLKPIGMIAKCIASATFEHEQLQSEQAQLFGCSESFNAWTGNLHEVGRDNPLLRTAGGHIHVGYANPDNDTSVKIIQAMDLFLGVPSVLLDPDTDRRKVYGKAGDYRLKIYGVEYRSLSTFWTENDELINWAFESALKAIEFVNSGGIITNSEDIIKCINECNKEMALEIMEDYHIEFNELVKTI